MAQRFGRVNRFGDSGDTQILVVHPNAFEKEPYEQRREKTLKLLEQLKGEAGPAALGKLNQEDRQEAFAPAPIILPVTDILFDSWALTTIRDKLPGRPPVEKYLHGIADDDRPETHVAWRDEVALIAGDLLDEYSAQDSLEDYPLKPHELLRDNSNRVFDRLKGLKAVAEKPDTPVWIVADDDSVQETTLGQLIDEGKEAIYYMTVILPPAAGGLKNGMLVSDSEEANDVADEWIVEGQQRRIRIWDDAPTPPGMRLIRTIDTKPDADEMEDEEAPAKRFWHWLELPRSADNEGSTSSNRAVLWKVHVDDVVNNLTNLVARLSLPEELKEALLVAAKFHDHGKRRPLFQRILGNFDTHVLWAKSGKRSGRVPETFRHEFASLFDVETETDFQKLSDEMKDLVLHLIAVHHGRGRPHFSPEEAFDPEPKGNDIAAVAAKIPRRFGRLQRKFGRWGLAYLESLLRAADYAASANPSAFVQETK
jgi:CRISPR-associated endonuclease/helicase Cas3